MIAITLPDGRIQNYDGPVTGAVIAGDIGPGLAKAALCIRVNDSLWDLSREIEEDATVAIVTSKDEAESLDILRHDAAHVLAEAVKEPGDYAMVDYEKEWQERQEEEEERAKRKLDFVVVRYLSGGGKKMAKVKDKDQGKKPKEEKDKGNEKDAQPKQEKEEEQKQQID